VANVALPSFFIKELKLKYWQFQWSNPAMDFLTEQ
jgi:hypothetical protein